CEEHFTKVLQYLDAMGIDYEVDPKLVRGLDYYTHTAFEILVEGIGAQSAICGGGRYNGLIEQCGGKPMPGIGFAMGMERVLAALNLSQQELANEKQEFLMLVALGEKAQEKGFELVSSLRQKGIPVSIDLLGRSLKAQLKAADREQFKYAAILGEEELEQGKIILRNLRLGEQEEISLEGLEKLLEEKYQEDEWV
ncbi:MAG: histidine--tRNA ligase, partial [Desulfitobacterium sp.]|nr:histidine--tRNA ligase [Desulfitobacterium sp.]